MMFSVSPRISDTPGYLHRSVPPHEKFPPGNGRRNNETSHNQPPALSIEPLDSIEGLHRVQQAPMSLSRPLRLLLLGAPGSGKGTQTSKLLKEMSLPTLSSGDLLRQHGDDPKIKQAIARGELIPDDVMTGMVIGDLARRQLLAGAGKSWLLDGFPRTLNQAVLLDKELSSHDSKLNCVVELNVPQSVILERIENRWVHIPSGRIYNLQYNPPKVAGQDDVTGEPLSKRPDDNVEVFQRRLDKYNELIEPLKQFYAKQGVLHTVDGETSDIIFPKLLKLIRDNFS